MKKSALFVLPSLIFFLSGCNETSTGAPGFLSNRLPTSAGGSVNSEAGAFSEFSTKSAIQKLIYHVGPVNLISGEQATWERKSPQTLKFQVSEPLWVVGFQSKMVNANGDELPGQLLYKAMIFNKQETNPLCSSSNGGNPFAAATSTLTKVELPEGFGYALMPNDPLEATVIFQNPTHQEYNGVMFSFELDAIPMDQANGYRDVKALLLDTDPCEHKPLAIAPGAFVEKSQTFAIPLAGNLMVANGILSDYGVAVSLTHQQTGNVSLFPFWRAEANLDETHRILNLNDNPFFDSVGKNIQLGDKLTLGISFNNFSEEWHNDATGAAMIYIAPQE